MTARNKNIPALRFKEFSGNWKLVLLDDVADRGSGHTPSKSYPEYYNGTIKWISLADSKKLDNGYIEDTEIKISEAGIKNSSAVLHPKDSVLLSRDAGIGKSAVMKVEMAVSQHFIVWHGKKNVLSNWFLYNILQILKPEFERIAIGSTIKTIGLPYFKKLKINIPSFPEQQKIASFLSAIDEKIHQLTRRKELLEQYKKGVMQQLFSGKLRFKDEQGKAYPKWEEKRLEELCVVARSGGTPKSTQREYYNGEIPFLSISDMTTQGKYLNYTSNHISKLGLENSSSWIVPAGSIIYSMYASVGFVAINRIPMATSQAVLNLILKENINTEYVYYALAEFQNKLAKFITTGTQGNLNAQTVKGFEIKLPSSKEQQKIASFLSSIDTKIESVSAQIEGTQRFKKGLLQQMFV